MFGVNIISISLHLVIMQCTVCTLKEIEKLYLLYSWCDTPKCVTSLWGPFPSPCTWATQVFLKKCCSGDEPLATLCLFDLTCPRLSLRPPASEMNALLFDKLADPVKFNYFCADFFIQKNPKNECNKPHRKLFKANVWRQNIFEPAISHWSENRNGQTIKRRFEYGAANCW